VKKYLVPFLVLLISISCSKDETGFKLGETDPFIGVWLDGNGKGNITVKSNGRIIFRDLELEETYELIWKNADEKPDFTKIYQKYIIFSTEDVLDGEFGDEVLDALFSDDFNQIQMGDFVGIRQ